MADGARSARYRVNDPAVIHQAIDGELVIIHLDRGVYYSLGAPGARMWAELAAGQPPASVAETIALELGADRSEVAQAVDDLVAQLSAEALLVPLDGDAAPDVRQSTPAGGTTTPSRARASATFERPVLQRYDDLQDLLLLDPIHAVDDTGWPERRDGG